MPSFPIIVDTQFSENVSTKGNRCGVTFSPPLQVPANANPRLRLYSSSIAYNFPNVSVELENNTLVIDRYDAAVLGHRHTVTFKAGLYGSLDDIAQVIKHSIHSDANFAELEINLIPVTATQRVHAGGGHWPHRHNPLIVHIREWHRTSDRLHGRQVFYSQHHRNEGV